MLKQENSLDQLQQLFPVLLEGDNKLQQAIKAQASEAALGPSSNICLEGMQCSHLALLIEGKARVFKSGPSGREITLYHILPGESCILTASCILTGRNFPAYARSVDDVKAILIPAPLVSQWMETYPGWRSFMLGMIAERLDQVISVVEDVTFSRLDQRIFSHLLDISSVQGNTLMLTHQQIADDLGTSREVVSRILKDAEHQGLLQVARGKITLLHNDRLERLAGFST